MVSRRFACLFLAVSMTLSSIWIVSADQSHQIQDAAEAAASYRLNFPTDLLITEAM